METEQEPELPQEPNSTIDLVHRAHRGEPEALDQLFARYYPRVRRVVRQRLGVSLRQHLESVDIVQGTFAQALKGFDKFVWRDERSLINWLSKYAQYQILEAVSRYATQARYPGNEVPLDSPEDGGKPLEVTGTDETPSQIASTRESREILRDCLAALPEKYRVLIALRTFGQLPFESVAQETGHPTDAAARMAYKKAIQELGKLMRRRGCS